MKLDLNQSLKREFERISSLLGTENVFLVGGVVRDSLLHKETYDLDIATPLKPEVVHSHFQKSLYYPRFGTVSFRENGIEVTIATFRKEQSYLDFRHPLDVVFVEDIESDFTRRDFTVNAIYADSNLSIIDPTGFGIKDIDDKIIRMIGDPDIRLKEDPLRIIRAYRFSLGLCFSIESSLLKSLERNRGLISRLNPNKIKMEILKTDGEIRKKLIEKVYHRP